MKNKGIVLMVTLFCVNNVSAAMYRSLPPVPMATITLDAILKGALGVDAEGNSYAWKANVIYRYNYSKAMRKGFANLNLILDRDIRDVNNDASLDQFRKMQALKGTIDALYNSLESYRAVDSQQQEVQPSVQNEPKSDVKIAECCICYEEKSTVPIPCENKHKERICQPCLDDIMKKNAVCPMCRGQLK